MPDLSRGHLEIARVTANRGVTRIEWLPVPDPLALETPTHNQVAKATPFNGGEGIAMHEGTVYFTTKGDNRVWAYDTGSQQLEVLYDFATSDNPILSGVDNVVITPTGDLLLAEDGGDMQIVVITPNRQLKPIVQIAGHDRSEITGPAFDPSHERLYFSSQRGSSGLPSGGITYEISRTKKISR